MGLYLPVTATAKTWPQDTNMVPQSRGGMPPVEYANRNFDKREAFTLTSLLTITGATAKDTLFTQIVPTPQDGDFWCDNIYVTCWGTAVSNQNTQIPGQLQLTDNRTGKRLSYPGPGIPIDFLNNRLTDDITSIAVADTLVPPSGFRPTATLPEPFCFTRQGGVRLDFNLRGVMAGGNMECWFVFAGWKEYQFASGQGA